MSCRSTPSQLLRQYLSVEAAGIGKLCERPEKPVSRSEPFEPVAGSNCGTTRHICFGDPAALGLFGHTASQVAGGGGGGLGWVCTGRGGRSCPCRPAWS